MEHENHKKMMKRNKFLGKKSGVTAMPSEKSEERMSYPSIRLEEKQMPMLKGKTVGDAVMLKMHAVVKGVSKYGDGDTEYSLDCEKGMME